MAMDPRAQAMMAMMAQQQQQGMGTPGMPMGQIEQSPTRHAVDPSPGETIPDQMSDEDMLASVQGQMGGGAPPPIGGMTWQNMEQDAAALESDPSEENITAFVQYWGEENLPSSLRSPDNDADDMGD